MLACLVLILIYSRPYSFRAVMPGFYDAPIIQCEVVYYEQGIGENGGVKYTTIAKSFDPTGDEYAELMSMLESVTYRKQLAVALTNGRRNSGYSVSYPYSEITFYQDGHVYVYQLFNRYLPAGPAREKWDYTPQGGRKFHAQVTEFIRTHGETMEEEVRQY